MRHTIRWDQTGIRIHILDYRFVAEDFKNTESFKRQYGNKMKYYNFHLSNKSIKKDMLLELKHPYLTSESSIEEWLLAHEEVRVQYRCRGRLRSKRRYEASKEDQALQKDEAI
jgi:hypothetical protein